MIIRFKKRSTATRVKVTDQDGAVELFDSVKAAASALGCTRQYIHMGLRTGRLVSGCKVEVADD